MDIRAAMLTPYFVLSYSIVTYTDVVLLLLEAFEEEKARKAAALERARRRAQFWWVDAGRFRGI